MNTGIGRAKIMCLRSEVLRFDSDMELDARFFHKYKDESCDAPSLVPNTDSQPR